VSPPVLLVAQLCDAVRLTGLLIVRPPVLLSTIPPVPIARLAGLTPAGVMVNAVEDDWVRLLMLNVPLGARLRVLVARFAPARTIWLLVGSETGMVFPLQFPAVDQLASAPSPVHV